MPPIRVTSHAIERYLERVGADSEAEAMAVLTGPAVVRAVAFGARIVRLTRCRIVIEFTPIGAKVLTVLPIEGDRIPFQLINSRIFNQATTKLRGRADAQRDLHAKATSA